MWKRCIIWNQSPFLIVFGENDIVFAFDRPPNKEIINLKQQYLQQPQSNAEKLFKSNGILKVLIH
jgi:hypothetical protein